MSLRRPRSLRVLLRTVVAIAVVAAVATAAVAATSSHGTTYRTALVTVADVRAELHVTGTIQPVSQASVAFPVSGTVASVPVKVGQTVKTGQTLATLDATALRAAVTKAEATLASAELALHQVLDGERVSGGSGGTGSNGSVPMASDQNDASANANDAAAPTTPAATNGDGTAAARTAVQQAQARVQHALAIAQRDLAAATKACAGGSTPPTTSPPTTTQSTTTSTTTPSAPTSDCAAAQATVMRDVESVATAEQALATAETKLAALLASSSGEERTPATTPTTSPSTSVDYTDTQVASYEASMMAAAAKVAAAQQDLAQATIVSPINGTVAAAGLRAGASVAAASSTAAIVVVGDGGYEVTTDVSIADRANLKVGDTATVVADGTAKPWHGRVVRIGVVESAGSSSSTYSLIIGFTDTPTGLRNGASASVTIVTDHTEHALTVPTSAIQTVGTFHTVTVIDHGKAQATRVEIGTVGAERSVVTSGLTAGQTVSLADVGAAIPSSGSTSNDRGGAFTNGLGGTGGPAFRQFGK